MTTGARDLMLHIPWERLSVEEQREFYMQFGCIVLRGAVPKPHRRELLADIERHGLQGTIEDPWVAPSFERLIENPRTVALLEVLLGNDLKFFRGVYVGTPPEIGLDPNKERRALHVDYGIGEPDGNFKNSCASWINIGYYLTGTSPDCAPLWVVPGAQRFSHLRPGADLEMLSPVARMVLAEPGDAVFFGCFTVHAVGHNRSDHTRHSLFYSYRPGWARPAGPVVEWPAEFIERAPPERRRLLRDLNGGLGACRGHASY